MKRLLICPYSYELNDYQIGQNPFLKPHTRVDKVAAYKSHAELATTLKNSVFYHVHPPPAASVPDLVFVANGGLSLRGLPEAIVLLPSMKYPQRQREIGFLKSVFDDLRIKTVPFPSNHVFEGQAEAKWLHGGKLLICGAGVRATHESYKVLDTILTRVYEAYGLSPPKLLVLSIVRDEFFHLDSACFEFDDSKMVIQKRAFSPESVRDLKKALGDENVFVIDTPDPFEFNAIVDGPMLITHKLVDAGLKNQLETITGRTVKMIDTSQFEISGGSVRCLVMDIYDPHTK